MVEIGAVARVEECELGGVEQREGVAPGRRVARRLGDQRGELPGGTLDRVGVGGVDNRVEDQRVVTNGDAQRSPVRPARRASRSGSVELDEHGPHTGLAPGARISADRVAQQH